jgi:hypothetical protein
MSGDNSGPASSKDDDFSLEPSLNPQLWVVRHRATGNAFRFLLLDNDKLDQNLTFGFERNPASDVDNAGQMKLLLEQVFHSPALLQIIDAIVEAGKNMG